MPEDATPIAVTAHQKLVRELGRVERIHDERRSNPVRAAALDRIAAWQAQRLAATYADLAVQPRYADAVAFFRTDLYGGADFAQRDADLARVAPVMTRMLPARVVEAIAQAMELNALSRELDRSLLARLPRADGHFSVAEYCDAYRRMGERAARERQIGLIEEVGIALDGFVRKPVIRAALAMMRKPAQLAGFSVLHDFLERGFGAFHRMCGARDFLATIARRETDLMVAIFAGDSAPFPEPAC